MFQNHSYFLNKPLTIKSKLAFEIKSTHWASLLFILTSPKKAACYSLLPGVKLMAPTPLPSAGLAWSLGRIFQGCRAGVGSLACPALLGSPVPHVLKAAIIKTSRLISAIKDSVQIQSTGNGCPVRSGLAGVLTCLKWIYSSMIHAR